MAVRPVPAVEGAVGFPVIFPVLELDQSIGFVSVAWPCNCYLASTMSDLKDHYNTCLYHAGAALGRTLSRMAEAHFHPIEITPTMGFILMTARAAPGINVKDLAYVHQLDPSTISRTIDKLAFNSFVIRNDHDKIVEVFLTPEGLHKAAEASSAWEKLRLAYMHLLGDGEAKKLAESSAQADAVLRPQL